MGSTFSSLLARLFNKKEMRILMVGLDAAGKTTILYKLKVGGVVTSIPTIGFNVESVDFRNIRFTVFDVGGQTFLRGMWRHYLQNCAALIYVVDSSDRERIGAAESELSAMLDREELKDAVILVFANKQDLPDALNSTQMAEEMRMYERRHEWYVQGTCARTGSGLHEGLEYLHTMLSRKR